MGTPTRDHLELGHQRFREGPTTTTETETQTETERQKQRLNIIGPGALGPGSGTEAHFEFGLAPGHGEFLAEPVLPETNTGTAPAPSKPA